MLSGPRQLSVFEQRYVGDSAVLQSAALCPISVLRPFSCLQFFLLSKAGTHGINLVSCRRIVVLEEHWNPVYNLQVRLWWLARVLRTVIPCGEGDRDLGCKLAAGLG